MIYCEKNTYKNFVSDYRYTLRISEEAADGYETEVSVEDVEGPIVYETDQDERAFIFTSRRSINSDYASSFTPQQNLYTAGQENSPRLVFTNTGEQVIAPTAVRIQTQPFAVMMLAGLLLAAGFAVPALAGRRRRRKAAPVEGTPGKRGGTVE